MRAIDSTILLMFFQPTVLVPNDESGHPIRSPKARVLHLIDTLEEEGARLIVPSPVLAETLVRATTDQFQEIVRIIDRHSVFRIEDFDVLAAQELAIMTRDDLGGKRKRLTPEQTAAKIKLDRQIVAIAKVAGATTIYSDDNGLRTYSARHGLTPIGLADIPLPPHKQQIDAFEADR